jgi:hypothetical protein
MRVWDAENSIYGGLRRLPWRRYLSAMWILGAELRSLFEDRLADSERSLIASTLDAVRETALFGGPTTDVGGRAAELTARWKELIAERENDVLPGQWNAWVTFESLAAELAGTAPRYEATERLTLAATDRWREPYAGKARRVDPNEEVADHSPMARTLSVFEHIVNGVAQAPEQELDPAELRIRVLEQLPGDADGNAGAQRP